MAHDKQQIMKNICDRIATSSDGLRKICKEVGIHVSTVREWIATDKDLADLYARAKDEQMDYLADEIIEIADASENDTIHTENGAIPNGEWINRSRLKVDTRKWIMAKLKPKKYGDRVSTEISGPDGGPVVVTGMKVL